MTIPRSLTKRFLDLVAAIVISPLVVVFRIGSSLNVSDRDILFQSLSQLVGLFPGISGNFLRRAFYRRTLRHFPREATVGFCTTFATAEVTIGTGVYIGAFCHIGHCTIGRDSMLGNGVTLLSGRRAHGIERTDVAMRFQPTSHETLEIGDDVWIGNNAIVMADLGSHCVVGAGSVVPKSVSAFSVVAGNPCRTIRVRNVGNVAVESSSDSNSGIENLTE